MKTLYKRQSILIFRLEQRCRGKTVVKDIYYDTGNTGFFSGPDKMYRCVRNDGKYVINKLRIGKVL